MTSEDFDTVTGADEDPKFDCDARPRATGRFRTEAPALTEAALADIGEERERQYAKWGPQHHPDGTGRASYVADADRMRNLCDARFANGSGGWADILLEEVYEALAETDRMKLRAELVQVAAVAAAWVEDTDSRG